ncbi:MAG: hypothetical protein SNF92_09040, partial [Rikenellaceae bacterium]
PAFEWVDSLNGDGTTYSSGAQDVWYIPSFWEAREVYCGASGLKLAVVGAGTDYDAGYVENWSTSDYNTTIQDGATYIANRATFVERIKAVSGDTMLFDGGLLWSSTEVGATNAYGIWTNGAKQGSQSKTKTGSVQTCAIMMFDLSK